MNSPVEEQWTILVVEDSEADRRLLERFLNEAVGFKVHLQEVTDGEEALTHLRESVSGDGGGEGTQERPDLVLLDLDLPGLNGLQLLKTIREDEALSVIPITVLATSDSDWTVREAYKLGASSYIVKPENRDHFERVMVDFFQYWFKTATLPNP